MATLDNLLQPESEELRETRKLYKRLQQQIAETTEQGNNALLDLQAEFDELAERKRELMRDIDELEDKYDKLRKKMSAAENLYGSYLSAIKKGREQ